MDFDTDNPVDLTLPNHDLDAEAHSDLSSETLSPSIKESSRKQTSKPSVLPTCLPPCRVCNAKASGFHYGVNTCEGCKAFFKRSIKENSMIKPCSNNGRCAENPNGKISCPSCRYNRCLQMGMAKQGCRKGRYPTEMRTKITKEFRKFQAEEVILQQVEMNQCPLVAQQLLGFFEEIFPEYVYEVMQRHDITQKVKTSLRDANVNLPLEIPLFFPGERSNSKTWATELMTNLRSGEKRKDGLCMMVDMWLGQLEQNSHGVTLYAKHIPGFSSLLLNDRIILLKSARGDTTHMIGHHYAFPELEAVVKYDLQTGDIVITPISLLQKVFPSLLVYDLNRIAKRMLRLDLVTEDIAILLAFVICAPYREGLQSPKEVEEIHNRLLPVLEYTLKKNHPEEPNIVANTLLMLPELLSSVRDCDQMEQLKSQIDPKKFPLAHEIFH